MPRGLSLVERKGKQTDGWSVNGLMPSCKNEKGTILDVSKNRPMCSALSGATEMTQFSQRAMLHISHNNVIKHFDFQQLARAHKITCYFQVCL
jgi:hypothetical protein